MSPQSSIAWPNCLRHSPCAILAATTQRRKDAEALAARKHAEQDDKGRDREPKSAACDRYRLRRRPGVPLDGANPPANGAPEHAPEGPPLSARLDEDRGTATPAPALPQPEGAGAVQGADRRTGHPQVVGPVHSSPSDTPL